MSSLILIRDGYHELRSFHRKFKIKGWVNYKNNVRHGSRFGTTYEHGPGIVIEKSVYITGKQQGEFLEFHYSE